MCVSVCATACVVVRGKLSIKLMSLRLHSKCLDSLSHLANLSLFFMAYNLAIECHVYMCTYKCICVYTYIYIYEVTLVFKNCRVKIS